MILTPKYKKFRGGTRPPPQALSQCLTPNPIMSVQPITLQLLCDVIIYVREYAYCR